MSDELITLQELGRRLGYPPSTIRDMYARGNFPAEIEVEGRPKLTRFNESAVREHLRPKKKAPAPLA
jgi:predicted DNA-binding transcriptional regulator AlpA